MLEHRYSFLCGCGAVVITDRRGGAVVLTTTICGEHIEQAYKQLTAHGDPASRFQLDWLQQLEDGAALVLDLEDKPLEDLKPRSESDRTSPAP